MKKILIIISSVALIIIICWLSGFLDTNKYYSPATSVLVTKKEVSDDYLHTIYVKRFGETKDNLIDVKIMVEDENTWNLIEEGRYYFITYEQTNYEIPILGQIEHNDKFGEIYKEFFNEID